VEFHRDALFEIIITFVILRVRVVAQVGSRVDALVV